MLRNVILINICCINKLLPFSKYKYYSDFLSTRGATTFQKKLKKLSIVSASFHFIPWTYQFCMCLVVIITYRSTK